jgi:putative endonuclease
MHFVYIIYSAEYDRYNIGESFNPAKRTEQHKTGFYKNACTSIAKDWELKLILNQNNRNEALVVEKHFKSIKSKDFIRNLIENTSFLSQFFRLIIIR